MKKYPSTKINTITISILLLQILNTQEINYKMGIIPLSDWNISHKSNGNNPNAPQIQLKTTLISSQ